MNSRYQASKRAPADMEWLFAELVALVGPAYFFLQILMAVRYRGRWRVLALAPLIVMVPLALHTALEYAAGSNAWPAPMLLASAVAFIYLLVVGAAKASIG